MKIRMKVEMFFSSDVYFSSGVTLFYYHGGRYINGWIDRYKKFGILKHSNVDRMNRW